MALIARSHERESPPAGTPTRTEKPSREDVARWLSALVAPEGCVELRAVGVTRKGLPGRHTEASFFTADEADAMARAALALSGRAEGVYWTLNPIHTNCHLSPAGASAQAKDVLSRRWLLVDCDPVKADAKSSASDVEKSASSIVAREVRRTLRAEGWPEPVLADSGNGYHLLYRIDLLADDAFETQPDGQVVKRNGASSELIRACLKTLAARFDTPEVSIDCSVFDAPRICKLYGTMARKGEPSADRPHRYSRVLDLPATLDVVPAERLAALANATAPPAQAEPARRGLVAKARQAVDPQRAYALAALKAETDRVASCGAGGRNVQLNTSAFALGQLVAAGQLSEGEAIASLATAATLCGLDAAESGRTIANGLKAGRALPRDLSDVGRAEANGHANGDGNGHADGAPEVAAGQDGDGPMEADDDPHRLARLFLTSECSHPDGATLRYWMERWHRWDGAAWRVVADAETSALLTRSIKREFDRIAMERGKTTQAVGTKVQGNAILALRSVALLTASECPRQPAWVGRDGPNPMECLSARNGIVHLPSLMAGHVEPIAPTPCYFTPSALDFDFDAGAPEPTRWLAFLASLWGEDPESIACLQEWFGYLLTADTRQQKMLLIIGPRRSGKGTILRILRSLVGPANVAAPTLSSLAMNFGAAPLIGKTLAIVPDARLSARSDAQVIIERLLSITGEDPQTIDRKHREDWTGDLLTRFVVASNELPRMGDASGALPGRVILLRLTRSFYGHENTHLFESLVGELPSVCLWAIAGWERLRARGRFLQPASGQALLDELDELSSPVATFVADRCQTGSECEVPVKALYAAWKKWCEERGKDHPGDEQGFGKNLRATLPMIDRVRKGPRGHQEGHYRGIELLPAAPY